MPLVRLVSTGAIPPSIKFALLKKYRHQVRLPEHPGQLHHASKNKDNAFKLKT
jgi:hypothetical protein